MAARGRAAPRPRTAVAALPRARNVPVRAGRPPIRPLPSRRSLALGVAALALAAGAYVAARETSTFAIRTIDVTGGTPGERAQVRGALAPLLGRSLLGLDRGAVERRAEALPSIVSARYDRAFPHTLRVAIVPEEPVAVLRRGRETWLVSGRGRVIARISARTRPALPRVWVPTAVPVTAGTILPAAAGGAATRALALAGELDGRVATAAFGHGELTFRLRSGVDVRLGEPVDLRLKFAVARRALALLPAGTTYLDVSAPGRPVAGADSQVSGRG
jgi:cell division protein FtsQ